MADSQQLGLLGFFLAGLLVVGAGLTLATWRMGAGPLGAPPEHGAPSWRAKWWPVVDMGRWIAFWFAAAITLTLLNRWLLSTLFQAPLLVTWLHFSFQSGMAWCVVRGSHGRDFVPRSLAAAFGCARSAPAGPAGARGDAGGSKPGDSKSDPPREEDSARLEAEAVSLLRGRATFWSFVSPIAVSTAADVCLSNVAVSLAPVWLYTIGKSTSLCFTYAAAVALRLRPFRARAAAIVLLVFAGVGLAAVGGRHGPLASPAAARRLTRQSCDAVAGCWPGLPTAAAGAANVSAATAPASGLADPAPSDAAGAEGGDGQAAAAEAGVGSEAPGADGQGAGSMAGDDGLAPEGGLPRFRAAPSGAFGPTYGSEGATRRRLRTAFGVGRGRTGPAWGPRAAALEPSAEAAHHDGAGYGDGGDGEGGWEDDAEATRGLEAGDGDGGDGGSAGSDDGDGSDGGGGGADAGMALGALAAIAAAAANAGRWVFTERLLSRVKGAGAGRGLGDGAASPAAGGDDGGGSTTVGGEALEVAAALAAGSESADEGDWAAADSDAAGAVATGGGGLAEAEGTSGGAAEAAPSSPEGTGAAAGDALSSGGAHRDEESAPAADAEEDDGASLAERDEEDASLIERDEEGASLVERRPAPARPRRRRLSPLFVMAWSAPLSAVLTALVAVPAEGGTALVSPAWDSAPAALTVASGSVAGAVLAFFMISAELQVIARASAVTMTVTGHVKEAMVIVLGAVVLGEAVAGLEAVGIAMVLAGTAAFGLLESGGH